MAGKSFITPASMKGEAGGAGGASSGAASAPHTPPRPSSAISSHGHLWSKMTSALRTDSFSSVYVLDGHQQQNPCVANSIFNTPAGRAIISDFSERKSPVLKANRRQNSSEVFKFLLNEDNSTDKKLQEEKVWLFEEDECRGRVRPIITDYQERVSNKTQEDYLNGNVYLDEETVERQDFGAGTKTLTDENRNFAPNIRLTRRVKESETRICINEEKDEDDARINEKIMRLKSQYERGFAGDEKCDILKRMLSGFLSGIVNSSKPSKFRKRKSSNDLYREASYALGIPCEMTDSCRCLDCQCNYFDCGDDSSNTSEISVNMNDCDIEDWHCDVEESEEKKGDVFRVEDEVSGRTVPETTEAEAPAVRPRIQPGDPEPPEAVEMAAGTPVLLDHLLNTPMSCVLQ